jgi:hypothetical protein
MMIDAGLQLGGATTPRTRLAAIWLIAGALVCAMAVGLRAVLPFNVDVSWLLIVCERVLDGQRLYLDILEINPPMAGAVNIIAVVLGRLLGLRAELMTLVLVFGLIAGSMVVTWRLLRNSRIPGRAAAAPLAVCAIALLGILPMYDFGQREHLALLFLLPALAVLIRRADGEIIPPGVVVIAGISAAITMCFKPYFAFGVGTAVIAAATNARQWRIVFAPENWIASALVVAYALWVYVAFPAYFTVIYPVASDVYRLLTSSWLALALGGATTLWLVAVFATLLLQSRRSADPALVVLLASSLGFAMSYFVQSRGYNYHAYPMVALALMAFGYAVATIDRARQHGPRLQVGSSVAAVALLVSACFWFKASVDVRALQDAVVKLGLQRPKIIMLGGAATIAHPLVRNVGGVWVSRQEALSIREIVRRARLERTIDAATSARFDAYLAAERNGLVDDIRKMPPDVVLIDDREADWSAWAQADPELAQLLKPYALVQTIDGIDILKRMP